MGILETVLLLLSILGAFLSGIIISVWFYSNENEKLSEERKQILKTNKILLVDLAALQCTCRKLQLKVDKFENDKENKK